ncbi:MAG: penicillin-binding protein, partial [Proteobacteria bacterium]|nr:penicillin-binding protein [Pseudomonadota bacterium]
MQSFPEGGVFAGAWRRHPRWVFFILALATAFTILLALRLAQKPALRDGIPYSLALQARNGELLRLTLAQDGQYRLWTPLAKMSPKLVAAVELYEDRWFRWHCGVNPVALLRGAWATASGDRRQGGSTLTMQLARRLYRIDSRSVGGKIHQLAAALWLEARYSKDEILEAYLNLAPYGGNIEGVGAAALVYFHKPVVQLSLPEALTLAVIPQNPKKRLANVALSGKIDGVLRQTVSRLWQRWRDKYPEDRR